MTMQHQNLFDRFSPYISFQGMGGDYKAEMNSAVLRAMLINKTKEQVDTLVRSLELGKKEYLPDVVISLSQENPQIQKTILNMLYAYQRFLRDGNQADIREKLTMIFHPRDAWVQGQYCVTSSSLLIVQAILYSHCEWLRGDAFESYSALRAFQDLETRGFPEQDCLFIAIIIAHQTLLRASWTSDFDKNPPEVLAVYKPNGKSKWEYAKKEENHKFVGLGLQKTLYDFVPSRLSRRRTDPDLSYGPDILRRELAASLVIHALCLQSRHSRTESKSFIKIKEMAFCSLDAMLAIGKGSTDIMLVYIHYGRYVYQVQQRVNIELEQNLYYLVRHYILGQNLDTWSQKGNFTVCFQRVSSKKPWAILQGIKYDESSKKIVCDGDYLENNFVSWGDDNNQHKTIDTKLIGRDSEFEINYEQGDKQHPVIRGSINLRSKRQRKGIYSLIKQTVGEKYLRISLNKAYYLVSMLNLHDKEGVIASVREWLTSGQTETTLDVIEKIIKALNDKYYSNPLWRHYKKGDKIQYTREKYFPTPLMGLVLNQLRDIAPDRFSPLHIICRGVGSQALAESDDGEQRKLYTIWLPDVCNQEKENIKAIEKTKIWDDIENYLGENNSYKLPESYLMVARYVAAMVIGVSVSLNPKHILLDYFSEQSKKNWGDLIENAIKENGGSLMQTYTTHLGCQPTRFICKDAMEIIPVEDKLDLTNEAKKSISDFLSDKYVLGIDIGGGSIRLQLFRIGNVEINDNFELKAMNDEKDEKGNIIEKIEKLKISKDYFAKQKEVIMDNWQNKERKWNLDDFIKFLEEEVSKSKIQDKLSNIIAVGVSLAAPVDKKTGEILSTSGPLDTYFGVEKAIGELNLKDIHKLNLKDNLREIFFATSVIEILNDGDADIHDTVKQNTENEEGVVVELKAGTGIAIAVREDGKTLALNSETSKAILNLHTHVKHDWKNNQWKPQDTSLRFQEGVMKDYVSGDGLKRLASYILTYRNEVDNEKPGAFVGKALGSLFNSEKDIGYGIRGTQFSENLAVFNPNPNLDAIFFFAVAVSYLIETSNNWTDIGSNKTSWQELIDKLKTDFTCAKQDEIKAAIDKLKKISSQPNIPDQSLLNNAIYKYCLGCAWMLGRWLADAIALIVDIFHAREIRLAGGPLSGTTGLLVAASTQNALEQAYGFDLEVDYLEGNEDYEPRLFYHHRIRELKRLRFVYPSADNSDISGARGAAKMALKSWIVQKKREQLLKCWGAISTQNDEFSAEDLLYSIQQSTDPLIITEIEVSQSLSQNSVTLQLTRTPTQKFRKYPNDSENIRQPARWSEITRQL